MNALWVLLIGGGDSWTLLQNLEDGSIRTYTTRQQARAARKIYAEKHAAPQNKEWSRRYWMRVTRVAKYVESIDTSPSAQR